MLLTTGFCCELSYLFLELVISSYYKLSINLRTCLYLNKITIKRKNHSSSGIEYLIQIESGGIKHLQVV